jgi:APA family basic amino acid/polyamine antiporter
VLGPEELAATRAPASEVMRRVLGERGASLIAAGIALSALGFLSQGILTAPRVYYAMAADGVFFRALARLHPRTRVPLLAIVVQGVWASIISLSGRYEQIINYVVSADFIWFGLTGLSLFVFRRRGERGSFPTPGHPWTTGFYVLMCWLVVAAVVARHPADSLVGWGILLCGVPVLLLGRRASAKLDVRG